MSTVLLEGRRLTPESWGVRGHDENESPVVNLEAAELAVRQLLVALGEDPDRDGLLDTPRRVAKAMVEVMGGRAEDPAVHLGRTFEQHCDELVLLKDIELFSLCEHHLMPFIGKAHVAYLPAGGQVVGLSKLARVVEVFARRPQLQERLTHQIADAIERHLQPKGVAVVVQAEHMCMKMRGVCKHEPVMHTFALRGLFKADPTWRSEVLTLTAAGSR